MRRKAFLAAPLPFPVLLGQDLRGAIPGRISDPSGAIMLGVETNETGNYRIPYLHLLPDSDRVIAEQNGFQRFVQDGVDLRVADQLTLNIRMDVGDVAEQVVVTGATPLLDAGTAPTGQVIDQRRLVELPLNGGNAFNSARFTDGVNYH